MGVGCLAQTGLLAPGIFDELAAAQLQGLELAHLFRRWRALRQVKPQRHFADHSGIHPVGPGQPPERVCKGPRPTRIDTDRRNAGSGLCRCAEAAACPPDASNATRPPACATRAANRARSALAMRACPSGPATSIQFFATSTPKTFSIMIPLFQSHGIGRNRPDQVCRTNHCGRGSGPETMPPSNQSIRIFASSRPQPS